MEAIAGPIALAVALASVGCLGAAGGERRGHARPAVVAAAGPGRRAGGLERRVFDLVNRHRQTRGLAPLAFDARLSDEARRHSAAMAAGSTPPGHRGFRARIEALGRVMPIRSAAENVAAIRDYDDPAAEAMRGWLASVGHRESIEGAYDRTGIGVASNAAGEIYFTQLFVDP